MDFVEKSHDVQVIANKHEAFVNTVMMGVLLTMDRVMEMLGRIVQIGDCMTISGDGEELRKTLDVKFMNCAKEFILELQELQIKSSFSCLERLILKLDYNQYYRDA